MKTRLKIRGPRIHIEYYWRGNVFASGNMWMLGPMQWLTPVQKGMIVMKRVLRKS